MMWSITLSASILALAACLLGCSADGRTAKFLVPGTSIPNITWDVGASYAGQLPLTRDADESDNLYFWYWPTNGTDRAASKSIVVWFGGGPGCSSLGSMIGETGPFVWPRGRPSPVPNPWSWHQLANVLYIDQPIGTGFSTGSVTAENDDDVAAQFISWWKVFLDTFGIKDAEIYLSGESYAGRFIPYIAEAMAAAQNTTYFNLQGVLVTSALVTDPPGRSSGGDYAIPNAIQTLMHLAPLVDAWPGVFALESETSALIQALDESCGYAQYVDKYLTFPPAGPQPGPGQLPGTEDEHRTAWCGEVFASIVATAVGLVNPCFNPYHITDTCPTPRDITGGTEHTVTVGAPIVYFNRDDVKHAVHAPDVDWQLCTDREVFAGRTDASEAPIISALPAVIDSVRNVILVGGTLDGTLPAEGVLLAIQNMTWGGKMGFQSKPGGDDGDGGIFWVPSHVDGAVGSGSGPMGTVHSERGLTFVRVNLAGHFLARDQPAAAFRLLEALLCRTRLDSRIPFTTQPDAGRLNSMYEAVLRSIGGGGDGGSQDHTYHPYPSERRVW